MGLGKPIDHSNIETLLPEAISIHLASLYPQHPTFGDLDTPLGPPTRLAKGIDCTHFVHNQLLSVCTG